MTTPVGNRFGGVPLRQPLPSNKAILDMGYDGFRDWVMKTTPDAHDGLPSIAEAYSTMRNAANDQAAVQQGLTISEHKQVFFTYDAIRQWQTARLQANYEYGGGGTVYLDAMSQDKASLTDMTARAIAEWRSPPTSHQVLVPEDLSFVGQAVRSDTKPVNPDSPALAQDYGREQQLLTQAINLADTLPGQSREIAMGYIAHEAATWAP